MSQENSKAENTNEKRKKILLVVLGLVLIFVIYLQFFPGSNDAQARRPAAAVARPSPTPTPRAGEKKAPTISEPLDLTSMTERTGSSDGIGRNIFIYPTPTPPPTPKPMTPTPTPIPPPVVLRAANPGSVFARSPDFNLVIYGEKIPEDGKIYLNGREFPATFVSAGELRTRITSDAIRSAGSINILVRSASDAKLFSNQIPLTVSEGPKPQYRYIGRIEKRTGTIVVLKAQEGEQQVISISKDMVFGGRWKLVSISPQRIVVEDTSIKVTHTIQYTGENG
jgi:hypothetical protein